MEQVNVVTVKGCSPLLVAVKYNSLQAIRLLLKDRRVELNTTDWKVNETWLHCNVTPASIFHWI